MSTSNLAHPNISTDSGSVPGQGDADAFAGGSNFVPDTALIERLANELFAGVPGGLSGVPNPSTASLGSTRPSSAQAAGIPFDFAAPLDLNLTSPTSTPNFDFKPDSGFNLPSNLSTDLYADAVLRDLLKDNASEHPKMTGATLYFLDEAARFNQPANLTSPCQGEGDNHHFRPSRL